MTALSNAMIKKDKTISHNLRQFLATTMLANYLTKRDKCNSDFRGIKEDFAVSVKQTEIYFFIPKSVLLQKSCETRPAHDGGNSQTGDSQIARIAWPHRIRSGILHPLH